MEFTTTERGARKLLKACDSLGNLRKIVSAQVQNVFEAAAVNLPSPDHLGKNVRQNRHRHPNSVVREALPESTREYQVTTARGRFLIHYSGIGDEKRVLNFGAPDALQLLCEYPHWFRDGTFKVWSRFFSTHSTVWFKIVLYLVFMLFYQINLLQDIMTDFEIADINAAATNFEGTEMKGYFLHLCSNLWKRIQRKGLQQRYIDDAEFALHFE